MTMRAKCKTDDNTKNDIPGAEVAAEDAVIMCVCATRGIRERRGFAGASVGAGAHVRVHYRYKL